MKNEDQFERRLRQQPLRQVPSAWREEILATAKASQRKAVPASESGDEVAFRLGWRLIFARLPVAWAALAAVWIVLVGVNLTLPKPMVEAVVQTPASIRMANLAALNFLAADSDLASELFVPVPETVPTHKPTAVPSRPRSERRRGLDFGEADSALRFDRVT